MALPIATTTITVLRSAQASADPDSSLVDPYGEGYDTDPDPDETVPQAADSYSEVATGVRAHISSPSGTEQNAGGSEEAIVFTLSCDPTSLNNNDKVVDDTTGEEFQVTWAHQRPAFAGLGHVEAGLVKFRGLA